jgi:tetratricopeptide (TPR) repeat protein
MLLCAAPAFSAEPTPRETQAANEAARAEERSDWPGAGYQWEQAMSAAESSGDFDRAIAHGERALAAWSHGSDGESLDRQAFALGVMCKLDLNQGRLTRGRERNLAALRIIAGRIAAASGWQPVPGQNPPGSASMPLLEAWARAQNDTANWLDAQGRTVEAVDLLTATETSMRAAAPDGRGFYHRKLLSTRANFLKFLGFHERAIGDLQRLVDTRASSDTALEWPQRFNLAYYSSQYFGPRPEYLDAVRSVLRELDAAGRSPRDARRLAAKMAFAYKADGTKVDDLEGLIAEAQASGAEMEAIYARRDFVLLGADLGRREGVEEALRQSLAELRRRGVKRGEPTLYREYGQFLVKDGRPGEGLRMLREAVRLTRAFGWTQHLPRLLAEIATAQGRIGDLAGLAQTLAELDALLAGGALVPERAFLAHCARARVLFLLGRKAQAAAAIAQATALADRAGFNEYQRFALSWTKAVAPAVPAQEAALAGIVDLQPVAIIATAEPGGTALARFRLSNPGAQAGDGILQIAGRAVRVRFDETAGIADVTAGAEEESAPGNLPLRVGAGEEIIIRIEATIGTGTSGLRLQWQSGEQSANATCHLRPATAEADDAPGATVSNTSLAFENPFYAVRLHHPVSATGGPQSFRVQPSRRCRVEAYDARSGALLAVDAEGDGAFRSAGDSVAIDADNDGFPDLPVDPATGRGEIEILIFPLPGAAPGATDTRLEVQTKTAAGWKAIAHDILKPPRRP